VFKWWRSSPNELHLMSAYRERVIRTLMIIAVIFFLPFAIYSFVKGYVTLGIFISVLYIILAVDAYANFRDRPLPIPLQWIIVPVVPTITYAVYLEGFGPALWSYPAMILFYFILARWEANLFAVIMIGVLSPMVYRQEPRSISIRFIVTMMVTTIFSNLLINIISGLQQKLMDQSIVDPLTQAFNRRQMDTVLDLAIERNNRTETHATICIFDVDHFKRVNDAFGHAAGDTVLKGLVSLVKQRMRKLDVLFRIGGEEFLLYLPDTKEEDAVKLAEQMRQLIAESKLIEDHKVTVSIGVCGIQPGDIKDTWLKYADDALYEAKHKGRNHVVSSERVGKVSVS
jgi:diguanylate cyclase (GGDEF)-like protein